MIAIDFSGNVVVTDPGNARVQIFYPSGQWKLKFGKRGYGSHLTDRFNGGPDDVIVLNDGNLAVSDGGNSRVSFFTSEGVYLRKIQRIVLDSDQELVSYPYEPSEMGITPQGDLVVLDSGFKQVITYSKDEDVVMGFFGNSQDIDWSHPRQDSEFQMPFGLIVDAKGQKAVLDVGLKRLQVFSSEGHFIKQLLKGQFEMPMTMTLAPNGDLIVSDGQSLNIWN